MKGKLAFFVLLPFLVYGCAPLIIGSAAGALGAYAASRDTVQGDTDKSYDALWSAAISVSSNRGNIKHQDRLKGYVESEIEGSRVWIRIVKLTRTANRLRVSSRKYHLPNLGMAEDIFVRIMEEAG